MRVNDPEAGPLCRSPRAVSGSPVKCQHPAQMGQARHQGESSSHLRPRQSHHSTPTSATPSWKDGRDGWWPDTQVTSKFLLRPGRGMRRHGPPAQGNVSHPALRWWQRGHTLGEGGTRPYLRCGGRNTPPTRSRNRSRRQVKSQTQIWNRRLRIWPKTPRPRRSRHVGSDNGLLVVGWAGGAAPCTVGCAAASPASTG